MRAGVAADHVPPAPQISHLLTIDERRLPQVVGGNEKMPTPPSLFECAGDQGISAHATIVEGKKHRPAGAAPIDPIDRLDHGPGKRRLNRCEMLLEFPQFKLV